MTREMLRYYFAGVAMQSLIQQRGSVDAQSYAFIARESYKLADAMLEAGGPLQQPYDANDPRTWVGGYEEVK